MIYFLELGSGSAPSFRLRPKNITGGIHTNVVFHCQATGVPSPTIKWVKYTGGSKTEIRTSARFIVGGPIDRNGAVYKHVTILRVQWSDAGCYGCEAQNKHGRRVADAYLTVLTG